MRKQQGGNVSESVPIPIRLGNINSVILLGRLCAPGDLRYVPSGAAVLGFRVAVDGGRYQDKQTQEWKQRDSSFFSVNVWNAAAERLSKTLHKGSPVLIEGQLKSRSWEKHGTKHYAVEILATRVQDLEKRDGQGSDSGQEPNQPEQQDDIPAF